MSTRPAAAGRDTATARRLAGKLARHWIGDAPPAEATDAIAAATREELASAENLVPAMTLLLASPGFLRR